MTSKGDNSFGDDRKKNDSVTDKVNKGNTESGNSNVSKTNETNTEDKLWCSDNCVSFYLYN